jgi:hypothetical protein
MSTKNISDNFWALKKMGNLSKRIQGPAYRIHTKRLIIRCWDPKDAAFLKKAIDDSVDH